MTRYAFALTGAFLGAFGLVQSASAVALVNTTGYLGTLPSITIGTETFTLQTCTSSLCSGLQMLQDGSNVGITLSSLSAGSPIISGTSSLGADLTMVIAVTGSAAIRGVGQLVTGDNAGNAANDNAAGFGETVNTSPATLGTVTLANTSEQWLSIPAGYTSLDLSKDIFVHSFQVVAGTVKVNTVTQDLQFGVPEPATIAVLLSGLVAAVASRRRRAGRRS